MKSSPAIFWFLLIIFLLTAPITALTEINGFVFDEQADLYYPGQIYSYNGYDIMINNNPAYPFIYIREPGKLYTWATFNWAFQYWISSLNGFDRDTFDVTGLYRSIEMSNEELNRFVPDAATKSELEKLTIASLEINDKKEETREFHADLQYDPHFILNSSLTELGGYQIKIESEGMPLVSFMDKENPDWEIGVYNYERQYWIWTLEHFDYQSINLRQLYTRIDLSKTELNRLKPDILNLWGYLDAENRLYNNPEDGDFQNFIRYLSDQNTPAWQIEYYQKTASNPAKRGQVQNPQYLYEDS